MCMCIHMYIIYIFEYICIYMCIFPLSMTLLGLVLKAEETDRQHQDQELQRDHLGNSKCLFIVSVI